MSDIVFSFCFLSFLFAAAWWDIKRRIIPNGLCLAFLLYGVAFAVWRQGVGPGLWSAATGCAILFSVSLAFWLWGKLGGGDVKLLAGVGAWLGPVAGGAFLVLSVLFIGAYGLVTLLRRKKEVDKTRIFALRLNPSGDIPREDSLPCAPSFFLAGLCFIILKIS